MNLYEKSSIFQSVLMGVMCKKKDPMFKFGDY